MARRQYYDNQPRTGSSCPTCGEQMPREFWTSPGPAPPVVHCDGSRVAWLKSGVPHPHHGRQRHPNCWHCHQPMGCDQCVAADALCKRCAAWTYPEHLAQFGPLLNTPQMLARRGGLRAPQVADYPADFQRAWHAAHAICDVQCWCRSMGHVDMAPVRHFLRRIENQPTVLAT